MRVRSVLLVALLCSTAHALDPRRAVTQYRHQLYTTEDGLPSSTVSHIAQTPDGYLWLGTYDGLARFDGVRFVHWDAHSTPPLPDPSISIVNVDGDGQL